jgi:hypothetical protein
VLIPRADKSHASHWPLTMAVGRSFQVVVVLDESGRSLTCSAGSNQYGQLGHGSAGGNLLNVELKVVRSDGCNDTLRLTQ